MPHNKKQQEEIPLHRKASNLSAGGTIQEIQVKLAELLKDSSYMEHMNGCMAVTCSRLLSSLCCSKISRSSCHTEQHYRDDIIHYIHTQTQYIYINLYKYIYTHWSPPLQIRDMSAFVEYILLLWNCAIGTGP